MGAYAKFIVAVVGAGLAAVRLAITDSVITGDEWITIVLAALTAIGVYLYPNEPEV